MPEDAHLHTWLGASGMPGDRQDTVTVSLVPATGMGALQVLAPTVSAAFLLYRETASRDVPASGAK